MKSCPTCNRTFEDTFTFCLVDGSILSAPYDPEATQRIPPTRSTNPAPTEVLPPKVADSKLPPTVLSPEHKPSAPHLINQERESKQSLSLKKKIFIGVMIGLVAGIIILIVQLFILGGRASIIEIIVGAIILASGGALLAWITHGLIGLMHSKSED